MFAYCVVDRSISEEQRCKTLDHRTGGDVPCVQPISIDNATFPLLFPDSTLGGALHEAEVTCQCLLQATSACVMDSSVAPNVRANLLTKCVGILVRGALVDSSGNKRLVTNSSIVELLSSVVRTIVQNLNTDGAEEVMSWMVEMFVDGKLDCLDNAAAACPTKFQPLQVGGAYLKGRCMYSGGKPRCRYFYGTL